VKRLPRRLAAAPLVLALAAALTLSACSSTGRPAAATVNGTDISRRTLQDDLEALVGNEDLVERLEGSQAAGGQRITKEAVPAALTASWLTTLVSQAIIDQAIDDRDLTVTDQDRTEARGEIEESQGFGPKATFEKFPAWFQDRIVEQQARTNVLRADLQENRNLDDATLQRFYEENGAQLCPSGRLVSHIVVGTQEQADQVVQQLGQGADFAQLADAVSTSRLAGPGGRLTCVDSQNWGQLEEGLRNVASALSSGATSGPVQLSDGFHIVRVDDFTFENARPLLAALIEQQVDPLNALLQRRLGRADITVDPRYGRPVNSAQGFAIEPPSERVPRAKPPASTTTTAPAGATSGG
jgi:parvulin-like peptidyl-prolyl isomerase